MPTPERLEMGTLISRAPEDTTTIVSKKIHVVTRLTKHPFYWALSLS